MKCLSRTEMQEFIDKELSPDIETEVSQHLGNCYVCSALFKQAVEDKTLIKSMLANIEPIKNRVKIPEFRQPVTIIKRNITGRFIIDIAAALLIGFLLLFRFDRGQIPEKIPEADLLIYEFLDGQDLNKLWHNKSQILIIQDENGNVIQSTITY